MLQTINGEKPYSDNNLFGAVSDGINIYAGRSGNLILNKYDMDGHYLGPISFTLPNVSDYEGINSITFDGRYFYVAPTTSQNTKIYKVDLYANPPVCIETINTATQVRALAYQPEVEAAGIAEGFWTTQNYNSNIVLINMLGQVVNTFSNIAPNYSSLNGIALDTCSNGGPYLWCNTPERTIVQIKNIYGTGALTGFTKDFTNDIIPPELISANMPSGYGLYTYLDPETQACILGGVLGSNTDIPATIFQYYLSSKDIMKFGSVYAEQKDNDYVKQGDTLQRVLDVIVTSWGTAEGATVTRMYFNTNGTTNNADIVKARLYYTGSSPIFNTDNFIGEIENPNGAFSITFDPVTLAGVTDYFWLAYDVSATAPSFNKLDAEFDSLVCSQGIKRNFKPGPVDGYRAVIAPMSGDYTVGDGGQFISLTRAFQCRTYCRNRWEYKFPDNK